MQTSFGELFNMPLYSYILGIVGTAGTFQSPIYSEWHPAMCLRQKVLATAFENKSICLLSF